MRAAPDRFSVLLLATVVAMLGAAEIVTDRYFDQISRVHREQADQRRALLTVTDSPESPIAHAAVLGNSLLLDAIDVPLLSASVGRKIVPVPYFVLATTYYDWLYGLRRLFAEGMRPRYVVLGLSPNQFASPVSQGDYSAHYLFQAKDLWAVARETRMDLTTTSSFVLAHYSKAYSTRAINRGFLLARTLPSVGTLLNRLAIGKESSIPEADLSRLAAERLAAFDELCRRNGSRFIFVIPPTYQFGDDVIRRAGAAQHSTVLIPVTHGALNSSYYQSDGFHLNAKGARIFTTELASRLRDEL